MKAEIKKAIAIGAKKIFGSIHLPDFVVEVPGEAGHGDYASNIALVLAKTLKKNPIEIASALAAELKKNPGLAADIKIAQPGFINFFVNPEYLGGLLKQALRKKEKFGQGENKKETVVIEYSSPNIAKPFGVHHLGSTIIGQALVNVMRFAGYKAVSLSFPGDWGTQFGLLIAGYKRWGDPQKIKKDPIAELLNLYVRFSQAAKDDPELLDEGRREFKKLENGDKENLKLLKWFSDESMHDFNRVYKMLGVKIEHTIGESFYEPELKSLVEDALRRGIAKRGKDGSVVIPIPSSPTPEIIQKSDGATIYTTRELAAIRHRIKKWRASKLLYVAANQQTFHLEQVFASAVLLGYAKREQLIHVKFGMMLGSGGKKFATREGKLIPLEQVLKEAVERARSVVEKLNPDLPQRQKEKIAKIVGIGAVKFFDLSQNRLSDIVFEWDKMLNLKGSSAPYIQYSYARLKSILRKARRVNKKFDPLLLKQEKELAILRHLLHFSEVITEVVLRYEPNRLAEYLLQLAEKVNAFYETTPVLKSEKELRNARLSLVQAAAMVIKTGCNLLGIEVPEEM